MVKWAVAVVVVWVVVRWLLGRGVSQLLVGGCGRGDVSRFFFSWWPCKCICVCVCVVMCGDVRVM